MKNRILSDILFINSNSILCIGTYTNLSDCFEFNDNSLYYWLYLQHKLK